MNLKGHKASPGYATGPAIWLNKFQPALVSEIKVSVSSELTDFSQALKKTRIDLENLKLHANEESQEILEAHLMLLDDPEVSDKTKDYIENKKISASRAYHDVIDEFKALFSSMEDDYLRQRILDVEDISQRVLFYIENPLGSFGKIQVDGPSILLAEDLTPSEILSLDKKWILGIATSLGASNSHTAILARSMDIPTLVGMGSDLRVIQEGQTVYLDSISGLIFYQATEMEISDFSKRRTDFEKQNLSYLSLKGQKSLTQDQVEILLSANISGPQDLPSFFKNDAEAVGLYRTEFLYLERKSAPTEQEQIQVYTQVIQGLQGKRIHIRTLDIGGDKAVEYLHLPKEDNPFLGLRAIRLCLQKPELFKTQLRALLRSTVGASWGLMFPMISEVDELLQALAILDQVKVELKQEGLPFSEDFEVGVMVEIPSMAWIIDHLAPLIDFVSLGTNDLLQYTCAADRLNKDLKTVYNPLNPGFLRQVHHIIQESRKHDLHVGICGSLSHHELLMPFLIGCGAQELSMTSLHILSTRHSLRNLKMSDCQRLVAEVLKLPTATQVEKTLRYSISH